MSSMNGTNQESGRRPDAPFHHQSHIPARRDSASDDSKKVISVIEENRVKLNQGWEELKKLDQLMSRMDQLLEISARRERLHASETVAEPAGRHAMAMTQAA